MKSMPVLLLLALATAALAAPAIVVSPQDDLPKDERKLLEHAQNALNHGRWQEAQRAYRHFIDTYPKSENIEQAYFSLANVYQYYSQKPADARDLYLQFLEKYPKSSNFWNAKHQLGQAYQQLHQKEEARKIYKQMIKEADANWRTNAIHQLWSLDNKQFWLYVQQSFTAGQEAFALAQIHNVKSVKFRAYRLSYEPLLAALEKEDAPNLQEALAKVQRGARRLVKEWTEEFKDIQNWQSPQVKFGATEPGVYVLEGEHDEVTLAVTMFVAQNGLVTKAAPGKLVVFAQDRASGKPVQGMKVRALNSKEARCDGVTDANGLYVTDKYKGGQIVGTKDGEVVSCQSWYGEMQQSHAVVYITTDRPVYRPNHTVHFKALHRQEHGEKLEIQAGMKVQVTIHDPKGNVVYREPHALNEFGAVSGSMTLGDEPPLGVYTVQIGPVGNDPNRPWQADWRYSWWIQQYSPAHGQFRVEEYRKPEYKVDVKFKEPRYLQGETVAATIQADYYFGSPVTDADVTYTVYRRPHWSYWHNWDYYYGWYVDDEEEGEAHFGEHFGGKHGRHRGWWGPGEQILQATGKTDKEGQLKLHFEAKKLDHDSVYTVVAQVVDLSRRTVDGSGAVKATRAEFSLAATTNKYVYKAGDKVNIKIRAQYPDETPAKQTDVKLVVHKHWWEKDGKHEKPLYEGSTRTDDHGIAELNFTPGEEGYLYATAKAVDRRGNDVTTQHGVWVTGDNWWGGDYSNFNGIEILPDKKTYNAGDTAGILLTSQYKNMHVLVTLEGKELYKQEVVQIKGFAKLYEVKLDRPEYAPNVFITVSAIKDNSWIQKQKSLIVNPSHRFVTVKVTADKKEYRPRDKARYTVETTGADGKPVSAEVALGVVDESIYAIQSEYAQDIRRHFVHRTWPRVNTYCSLQYHDYGHAADDKEEAGAKAPAPAGVPAKESAARGRQAGYAKDELKKAKNGGDGGETYAATETRSLFADTMLWSAHVRTDASGRAVVEATIPDNVTTWRATARASTADSRFGQAVSSAIARKNVIVRLEMPRFLTQNDQSVVSAVAHNYLNSDKEFKIVLEAEGLAVTGALESKVKIAANDQKRIDWKAVAKVAGAAKITVKMLSDEESDAMQVVVPVQPHGSVQWKSLAGLLEKRVVEKISIPKDAKDGIGDVMVVISPTHASTVLDALDYLVGYPYGCVEQTMSRFLPCVVVAQAIQRLGLDKPDLLKELPKMVQQGLQRLYNFQHPDGGWGWWQHDQSAPPTTAYVMIGLALARAADHPVDDNAFGRGVSALRHQITAKETTDDGRAYALYALSLCGQKDPACRDRLSKNAGDLGTYAKALVALVLHADGKKDEAKAVLALLEKDAQIDGGRAWWRGGERFGWFDHQAEIAAAALRAFVAIDPSNAIIARIVTWLSTTRQGNYWASTKQTALVVQALCEYLALTGDLKADMTISLSVNGDPVFKERVTKDNWTKFQSMRAIPAKQLNAGDNEIVIEKEGSGTPIWSIYVKSYTTEENIGASKEGLRVERRYGRVTHAGGKRVVEALDEGATVRSGDEIEVTLVVRADCEYEYLMIDDPLPSGFEPIREHVEYGYWSWWYSRKEFRDERVSIAITHMGAGEQQIQYVMRAETPGDLHVLPARVWNMYHPQIGGNSAESRIKVIDR